VTRVSDAGEDEEGRFRTVIPRWRPVGGMERAACTGKNKLL
jgi:hypothetical protein